MEGTAIIISLRLQVKVTVITSEFLNVLYFKLFGSKTLNNLCFNSFFFSTIEIYRRGIM